MKILLLHKYGQKAASFRYRFQQYIPYLEERGIQCSVSSLLQDDYLVERFNTGKRSPFPIFRAFFQRLAVLLQAHRYDLVVIYCEVLPYFPSIFERYLKWRGVPYVVDFDDAIFHAYDLSPYRLVRWTLGNKIKQVIARASYVFAGNRYLADYSASANQQVLVLPTVVDLHRYRDTKRFEGRQKTLKIGWIGSPSTASYLEVVSRVLKTFCERHDAKVILVGSGKVDLSGFPLEIRKWSEESEIADILDFDIGIMPLTDSPWSRGKCGFKLIQYMACGLPVIASAVGTNNDIVEHGKNGFLCTSEAEWLEALETLWASPELQAKMGQEGRRTVETRYSLQVTAPHFIEVLNEIHSHQLPATQSDLAKTSSNLDPATVMGFGDEWTRFDQSKLNQRELGELFGLYFKVFPWDRLPRNAQGFDLGCGSGRWAKLVAPRVGKLHCIDPSGPALTVSRRNLAGMKNCQFHQASVDQMPIEDGSMDFGYALGILHHVPDTAAGIEACVRKLKPGAPLLLYLYYHLDGRPEWFKSLWRATNRVRRGVSRLPYPLRYALSQVIAAFVYFPLARSAMLMERLGIDVSNVPLSFYRNRSFYTMRTDTLDRFGTQLEQRFSAERIKQMMEEAGLENVQFSDSMPRWCVVGYKQSSGLLTRRDSHDVTESPSVSSEARALSQA